MKSCHKKCNATCDNKQKIEYFLIKNPMFRLLQEWLPSVLATIVADYLTMPCQYQSQIRYSQILYSFVTIDFLRPRLKPSEFGRVVTPPSTSFIVPCSAYAVREGFGLLMPQFYKVPWTSQHQRHRILLTDVTKNWYNYSKYRD